MPDERPTAVYHLDVVGHIAPGRLIRVDDWEGGQSDIYLHPLHVREALVHELNSLSLHQIGHGLWRQRWTDDGRMSDPVEGLGYNVSRWEFVSADQMPKALCAFPIDEDGSCIWQIKAGYCTTDLLDEMNAMLERIAGDGLWLQAWHEEQQVPILPAAPLLTPTLMPSLV